MAKIDCRMIQPAALRALAVWLVCCLPLPALALPRIMHWQTSGGAQVYFIENHDLPMLDASVEFPAGSAHDDRAHAGLANLTRHLLHLGAGGLTDDAISHRLAGVGATLGGNFDLDRAGLSVRTLSDPSRRQTAVSLLATMLSRPDFPEAVIAREKQRIIDDIREADTQPESLTSKAFYAAVYGTHPYALPQPGFADTVTRLTRADILAFYRRHYQARHAVVALLGDISRRQAEAIAEQLTAQLPAGADATAALPVPSQPTSRVVRIPHPASQAHVLMGEPGVKRGDPDYYALYVGNYILGGGGFSSRLMANVREKRGLVYSIYSYFMPYQEPGPFTIGLQTQRANAPQAIALVQQTLQSFLSQGPTDTELRHAKSNIIDGFPLRIDSNRKQMDYLQVIGFYRLPLTYLEDFPREVTKVTAAEVRSVFARRVHPANLVTVVTAGPDAGAKP